jgi:hypothetical protein
VSPIELLPRICLLLLSMYWQTTKAGTERQGMKTWNSPRQRNRRNHCFQECTNIIPQEKESQTSSGKNRALRLENRFGYWEFSKEWFKTHLQCEGGQLVDFLPSPILTCFNTGNLEWPFAANFCRKWSQGFGNQNSETASSLHSWQWWGPQPGKQLEVQQQFGV